MVKPGSLGQQLSEFINRSNCMNFSVWYSSQPRAAGAEGWLSGNSLPLFNVTMHALSHPTSLSPGHNQQDKGALVQKADAGTPLSRGEHVCRCFPMIARNLSNSRNKFVLCRPAFHGYWLFYCFRAGAWLKYRISSLETRKNAALRLEQKGWNSGKIGWGVTITPFLPHTLEEGA